MVERERLKRMNVGGRGSSSSSSGGGSCNRWLLRA